MPSTKPTTAAYRIDPATVDRFKAALGALVVPGDPRRKSDAPKATPTVAALMEEFADRVERRDRWPLEILRRLKARTGCTCRYATYRSES